MLAGEFPGASAQGWVPFLMGAALPERAFLPGRGLVELLESVGYAAGATRVALSRLCADGSLERRRDGRLTSYRLTPEMADTIVSIEGRVGRFGHRPEWDGTWTVVLASVPDDLRSRRRKMRSRLAYLGFGRLREAAWVAARECESEVADMVETLQLHGLVDVFVGRPWSVAADQDILHRCWDIDALSQRYQNFVARFADLAAEQPGRRPQTKDSSGIEGDVAVGLTGEEALRWWLRLTHDYRELVHRDPELPLEFLPGPARALRQDVVETFARVQSRVRPGAEVEVLRALGQPAAEQPAQPVPITG